MTRRTELINKYALDVSVNLLDRLDEIVRLENIENNYDSALYISFDVVTNDTWRINFWGDDSENIYFQREGNTNYFKMISNRKAELDILLTDKCEKFDSNCTTCPYAKECEEYSRL